ncbi:MAG: bifunctional DNA primase/polymerase [Patescibacteria group bacterium]
MQTIKNKNLQAALHYVDLGFSVIPIPPNSKKPIIKWKTYQTKKATKEEIQKWFSQFPNANVGIVTGAISGIVVIDVEAGGKPGVNLPPTVISKTGRDGRHYYYKHPGKTINNPTKILDKTDIRGDGGFVVAPPSIIQPNQKYEWLVSPDDAGFADLPEEILEKIGSKKQATDWEIKLNGVEEGKRNCTATEITGKFLAHFSQKDWEAIAWPALRGWNLQNIPPLPEQELRNVFESIKNRQGEERVNINLENFKPLSLSELMQKKFEDTMWTVKKLVPFEGITAISGAPAVFKTWLILFLAIKVAAGENLFDQFTTMKSGVLLVDEENGERLLHQRLKKLRKNFSLPFYFTSLTNFSLSENSVLKVIKITKEKNIKLVIFDSLVRIHGSDENDATKMAGVLKHIKALNKAGLTVIFTHHNRKQGYFKSSLSQSMRGSSDILASVDCHLALEKKKEENFITITQTKLRQEQEMKPFKLGIISDENHFKFEYQGEIDEKQIKKEDCKKAIKEVLEQEAKPMYKKELLDALKKTDFQFGQSTFKMAIKELVEDKKLFEKKGQKNTTFCALKPFESE